MHDIARILYALSTMIWIILVFVCNLFRISNSRFDRREEFVIDFFFFAIYDTATIYMQYNFKESPFWG